MAKKNKQKKNKSGNKNVYPQPLYNMPLSSKDCPQDRNIFEPYEVPENILGVDKEGNRANDSFGGGFGNFNITNDPILTRFEEGIGFPGYPYLAQLSCRSEYRTIVQTRAQEMTREGISFEFVTKDQETEQNVDKLQEIEAEFKRLDILNLLRKHLENDAYFGISHIYIDLKEAQNDPEEKTSPLILSDKKIKKGSLVGLRLVEPIWTTPVMYDTIDPFDEYFYKPSMWWVLGQQIHASRLLTTITNPVPDVMKPAYNFGGVPFAFMCKPYVDNWLRTRQSVSDLIKSFSVMVLKTDLSQLLSTGCSELNKRAALMAAYRDNRGLQIVDKETEEFTNVSASLSGLDKLQAQSQEHMAAVSGIPLVKLLGVTPSGLNASSDGEIRTFYDRISAIQESNLRPVLSKILKLIQLNLYGKVEDNISFTFNPLWQLDALQQSTVDLNQAQTLDVFSQTNTLKPEEIKGAIRNMNVPFFDGVDLSQEPEAIQGGGEMADNHFE
ncbi:DUF1073 domain-containing protein [Commensalibacter communis]|uniref:DUF1073 domain-containing protein n=1 Tax=Commensalibacter communis TaxID=2972786 RepID=UPI0022FF9D66|nr:DUF1073 domain-containing protein [Commensalibacter communis]CAI3933583.1 DUF1073 domain [Commensalibacter communis]CAI3944622.1 DUF1073 domain [Commensalibacter communis]